MKVYEFYFFQEYGKSSRFYRVERERFDRAAARGRRDSLRLLLARPPTPLY